MLEEARPGPDERIAAAPAEIVLTLGEPAEPALSRIRVTDAGGQQVDLGNLAPGKDGAKTLTIGLKPLAPGQYRVEWVVVSVDTHRTEGSYSFVVAP